MKKYLFMLFSLVVYFNQAYAVPVGFDAINGTWTVSGTDTAGIVWDNSTITFESQVEDGGNFLLEGHFDWIGSSGAFGRENFTGTLFSNDSLELTSFELVPPTFGIVTGDYFATLADSGTEFINGSWAGVGAIPSDDWSAVLEVTVGPIDPVEPIVPPSSSPVPEPGTVLLFSIGMIGLLVVKRKVKE